MKGWLYLNSFQSGKLLVYDLSGPKLVRTIAVDDNSGGIGAAVTSDGRTLFVLDGQATQRLRIFDAAAGREVAKHGLTDRLELLGGGPVLHLTADDRFVLVSTYNTSSAASGVKVFSIKKGAFLPAGLGEPVCGMPRFASSADGLVVAVCPDRIQGFRPKDANGDQFLPAFQSSMPISEPVDAVTPHTALDLSVIERATPAGAWRLFRWHAGAGKTHDLRTLLGPPEDAPGRGGQCWLDVSSDGARLALVHGRHLWILDNTADRLLRRVELPWYADRVAFTPDGNTILTLRATVGDVERGGVELAEISASGELTRRLPLNGVKLESGPTVFLVTQAPDHQNRKR
jgi:hypothetical protein